MKTVTNLIVISLLLGNLGAVTIISLKNFEKLHTLISAGYEAYEEGQPDSAHEIFENLIKLDTTLAEGYYHNGCIYAREGKDSIAIDYLVKAIKKNFVFLTYRWILQYDNDWNHLRKTRLWDKVKLALNEKINRLKHSTGVDRKYDLVEITRIYAVIGDTDSAVRYLSLAVESGFSGFQWIENNSDFSEIFLDTLKKLIKKKYEWTGTVTQKIWGLMLVYSEIKYNCANLRLGDFNDWDEQVRKFIPLVIEAKTRLEYYRILRKLVATINDNHTWIKPPPDIVKDYTFPPIKLIEYNGKVFVQQVLSEKLIKKGVNPGLEVIEVNDIPVQQYLLDSIYPYFPHKPKHFLEWIGAIALLGGRVGSIVKVKFRDVNGRTFSVNIERGKLKKRERPLVEMKLLDGNIVYFNIRSFMDKKVLDEFFEKFDSLNLEKIRGMIIDVRENGGGNSGCGDRIISHLIQKPIKNYMGDFSPAHIPRMSLKLVKENFVKLNFSFGYETIKPAKNKVYTGPLIVLTSPYTCSAAEDFVRPLKESGRAIIVGMPTCGGTGNPYYVNLPGGGVLRICIDSEPFVGKGIMPDIIIYPTQKDLAEGRDPVLEKAINILKSKFSKSVKP